MDLDERRAHARLALDIPCTLITEDGTWEGRILDLSYGGASISAPSQLARIGEVVMVEPASASGLRLPRFVVTVVSLMKEKAADRWGAQFSRLSPEQHAVMTQFIDGMLVGAGIGNRKVLRAYHVLEVACRTSQPFRASMTDISRGGMAIRCLRPLAPGEPITVSLTKPGFDRTLELHGTVANARDVGGGVHRAGISYAPLTADEEALLSQFIVFLLRGGPA